MIEKELPFDGLIWDAHSGIKFDDGREPPYLQRYIDAGVTVLTLNVGSDVSPWSECVKNLANFRAAVAARQNQCVIVHSEKEIRQAKADGKLGIVFDIEGMNSLDGSIDMLDVYYELGVRQMTLTYNKNNGAASGCHDSDQKLTDFGRDIVRRMNRVGMVIDCSHVSCRSSLDAMEISEDPVVFSHSNCRGICEHERNLFDEQIVTCAAKGGVTGVTGIGVFLGAVKPSIKAMLEHIDYKVELVGAEHVGIGLDYFPDTVGLSESWDTKYWPPSQYPDGANLGFMDPEAFPQIADALSGRGYSDQDIRGIMGENFLRVAASVWK
ncbi:Membrane dipeptidase [Mesorhizobium plurifarium]|uniref:Membrane dipeptidase n=1 Tax=Mesorhizobium plurifarium TaxID=69974 RepID=A0A090EP69_MESPL|nr:Membrane dipeptidase [Mesorhizobium plurifarium]